MEANIALHDLRILIEYVAKSYSLTLMNFTTKILIDKIKPFNLFLDMHVHVVTRGPWATSLTCQTFSEYNQTDTLVKQTRGPWATSLH